MKNLLRIFFASIIFLSSNIEISSSMDLVLQTKKDSANLTDENGFKQGKWIIYNKSGNKVVEKGNYIDDKKEGVWIAYFDNTNIKSEITYVKGKPRGFTKLYYENGQLRESGNWQLDHWEGNYKYYHESGQISYDWNYNEYGKREGEQKYYHANGNKMYEGNWNNGKTEGSLNVYNEDGKLVEQKIYNEGVFAEIKSNPKQIKPAPNKENEELALRGKFNKTGFHTVFNLSGNVNKKGYFVKGNLFNGEEYIYNDQGTLIKVLVFKNGQLINTILKNN